jgi:hypothetical protein
VQYIPLNQLITAFGVHPLDEKALFIDRLKNSNQLDWEIQQVIDFVEIQNQQTLVFNAWIEQHEDLKLLLLSGKATNSFNDKFKWKQHQFFNAFKVYVSSFFDILLLNNNASNSLEDWAKIFSYFELIEKEQRFYLEQKCYAIVKVELDKSFQSIENQLERKLFESNFSFLVSTPVLTLHSFLSTASNHLKIDFVERVLKLFKHPFCTAKLANWVLLQLQTMKLNEQQIISLNGIKAAIISGEYTFSEPEEVISNKRVYKKPYRFVLLFGAILAFLVFIYKYDFSMKPELIHEGSALKYFSVKERKEIDSIIRSMDSIPKMQTDPSYYSTGLTVLIRQAFENKTAEKLYLDFEKDRDLHYAASYDTSLKLNTNEYKGLSLKNTKVLAERKTAYSFELKNESEYGLLILCWENRVGGNCFSHIQAPKSTFNFQASKNDYFLILPGFDFGEIPSKQQANFDLLNYHFGSIDFNFESALQQYLVLKSPQSTKNKILMTGKKGDVLDIMDSNGAFERN